MSPPWAPMPGTRNAEPRRDGADRAQLGGRGGADDQSDRPARSPRRGAPGDAQVERLGRGVDRRVGGDDEVLELGRLGVRRPAQDVGVAVGAFEERGDRRSARVRIDGHRIGARADRTGRPPGAPRSSRCRRAWRRRRPACRPGSAPRIRSRAAIPADAERLVEGQVRLDRRGVRPGRLDDQRRRTARRRRRRGGSRRAGWPGPGRGRGTGRCRPPRSGSPAARGRSRSRARRAPGRSGRRVGTGVGVGAGSWSGGTYQPGRDAPSSPDTSVRSMTSLTVQSGAAPVEPDHPQVDDLALDVQERDRVAGRRPDRRPRRPVVGQAQELAAVRGVEDHEVVAERCSSWSRRRTGRPARRRARGSPGR